MRNNKKLSIILVMVLMLAMVMLLASCSAEPNVLEDYMQNGENGTGNLTLIGKLVQWMHSGIGSMGLTVIVFTFSLKLVMTPLDYWQRLSMRKSSVKMTAIKPLLEEIDRNYGKDSQRAQQEKQKIYKTQQVSTLASCLPMIVTMLVFIMMFNGLTNYATHKNITNYDAMYDHYWQQYDSARAQYYDEYYNQAIADGMDDNQAKIEADKKLVQLASKGDGVDYIGIADFYQDNIKEEFLWMNSVWQPDTWEPIMPTYDKFTQTVKIEGSESSARATYDIIRNEVLGTSTRSDNGSWNGLMILPFCSIGLSFLSIYVSQRLERKNKKGEVTAPADPQQAATQKTMMFTMPLMMAFFGFMYTGAFAIYMVCNYTFSIITTIILKKPIDNSVEKALAKVEERKNQGKANYMR